MSNSKVVFGYFFIFLICILSYSPLALHIDDINTNTTTQNAMTQFLDAWFGLFWIVLSIFFLALAIFEALGQMNVKF